MTEIETKKEYSKDELFPRVLAFEKLSFIDLRKAMNKTWVEWLPECDYLVTFNMLERFELIFNVAEKTFWRLEMDGDAIEEELEEHAALAESIEKKYDYARDQLDHEAKTANAKRLREIQNEVSQSHEAQQNEIKQALSWKYVEYVKRQRYVVFSQDCNPMERVLEIIAAITTD